MVCRRKSRISFSLQKLRLLQKREKERREKNESFYETPDSFYLASLKNINDIIFEMEEEKKFPHKKVYIKKFSKIADITVWIVNGRYIRTHIDEEFTNYGQHYRFNFIPENEFWIDKQHGSPEEKYYIDSMLTMRKLLTGGVSHKEAIKEADRIERRERRKSEIMKEMTKIKHDKEKILEKVHVKFLKSYSNGVKVWIVNGELVRNLFFLDFTEGGHDKVYPFIPEKEVWLDDDLSKSERKFVLLHEMHERGLMSKGVDYDSAHIAASKVEFFCRKNPKEIDKELRKEIKINQKY